MLTLKNFELQVNDAVVHRGRAYYEKQAVTDLEEAEKDCWYARVKGSESYMVEVRLVKKNNIESYSCDCPFEGGICKHVVAALFYMKDAFKHAHTAGNPEETAALKAAADKAGDVNEGRKYTELCRKIIKGYTNGGFIDRNSANSLAKELGTLTGESRFLLDNGELQDAFIVLQAMIPEVIKVFSHCDDSGGNIGDVIFQAIELIKVIAKTEGIDAALQEDIFNFIRSSVSRNVYFDYGDFGYEMVDLYQSLALKLGKEQTYLKYVEEQIDSVSPDEDPYRKKYFLVRKIVFLKAIGRTEEARLLSQQHLDFADVRKEEVNSLIDRKEYSEAKRLLFEGIEIAKQKRFPGIVTEWEKGLLRIAVLENDVNRIRYYAKRFAFDMGFDQHYYHQWKNTFNAAEWKIEIENYIEEVTKKVELQYQEDKGSAWYFPETKLLELLAPVYIEEQFPDRILALLRTETDLNVVLKYHACLADQYPLELLAIYLKAFERYGEASGGRGHFQALAAHMKTVMDTLPEGKQAIIALAKELSRKYPRRPALAEELKAIIQMEEPGPDNIG